MKRFGRLSPGDQPAPTDSILVHGTEGYALGSQQTEHHRRYSVRPFGAHWVCNTIVLVQTKLHKGDAGL